MQMMAVRGNGTLTAGVLNDECDLIESLHKLHTTPMGADRIRNNLELNVSDVVEWCRTKIKGVNCEITRKGKKWYVSTEEWIITVNAYSYTVITAHKQRASTEHKA